MPNQWLSLSIIPNLKPFFRAISLMLVLTLAGCGSSGVNPNPVDPERAREVLKTTLESWKKGEAMSSLSTASPAITAQDFDWMNGASLVSYQLVDEGKTMDANLLVAVNLIIKTKDGKEVKKSVSYLVTTSPAITVFRDFE